MDESFIIQKSPLFPAFRQTRIYDGTCMIMHHYVYINIDLDPNAYQNPLNIFFYSNKTCLGLCSLGSEMAF